MHASTIPSQDKFILVGKMVGAFGVLGELKVQSYTAPWRALLRYQPWQLRDAQGKVVHTVEGATGRETAKGLVVRIADISTREQAEALHGLEIWVARQQLPAPSAGEYYWVDLEGLTVINRDGVDFGKVSHLFNTGANDVLVVQGERERMLPFVQPDVIIAVDFEAGCIHVDWDADF